MHHDRGAIETSQQRHVELSARGQLKVVVPRYTLLLILSTSEILQVSIVVPDFLLGVTGTSSVT